MKNYFIKVTNANSIKENTGKKITINQKSIALFKNNGKIYAIQNRCPHQGADLADGYVKKGKVVCPLHEWAFDLNTGTFVGNENTCINTYQVKIDGNDVLIRWENE